MCGRFTLFSDLKHIQLTLPIDAVHAKVTPNYNIAPTQPVLTVVQREGVNILETMRWGLIPSWAKDAQIGYKMINARAETVAEKPSFKRSFQQRRCLIVADGFYEWRKDGTKKTPMFIRLKSKRPFSFAGLYAIWKSPEGEAVTSCTIITTAANELMRSIHDRMPVILPRKDQRVWLDPAGQDLGRLVSLLKPYPEQSMECYAVSPIVNSPQHNSPECIQSVE